MFSVFPESHWIQRAWNSLWVGCWIIAGKNTQSEGHRVTETSPKLLYPKDCPVQSGGSSVAELPWKDEGVCYPFIFQKKKSSRKFNKMYFPVELLKFLQCVRERRLQEAPCHRDNDKLGTLCHNAERLDPYPAFPGIVGLDNPKCP